MADLFDNRGVADGAGSETRYRPLAMRMRPNTIDEVVGQKHLLEPNKPLYQMFRGKRLHSFILWGPPGSGKTTLARIAGASCGGEFVSLSAVLAGIKDVQKVIQHARKITRPCVLFIDEVHRFNKAQQDSFLPEVENGTLILIGATTENPSFEVNNALLSRVRVYVLHRLSEDDIFAAIERAFERDEELRQSGVAMDESERRLIAGLADGDARTALNLVEVCIGVASSQGLSRVTEEVVLQASGERMRRFDAKGEAWFDLMSAVHKSIRGSDPNAALYYVARMLDGGCDPLYIARRLVRIASEDIGNADAQSWTVALNAWMTYERLGSPEGELALGHAAVYLACAPKSNAVYAAFNAACAAVKQHGSLEVPMRLRNAPTRLMREQGYGSGYRYAHDEAGAFAAGETYLPDEIKAAVYYQPTDRGDEATIKKRMAAFAKLNREWRSAKGDRS